MVGPRVSFDRDELVAFCKRNHIRKLSLFGSVIRDDFGPESDVDVLVEFEPEHVPGWAFFGMQEELSRLLGRRVDLNTPGCFRPPLRNRVLKDARVLYG